MLLFCRWGKLRLKKLHWGQIFWIEVAVLEWKPKLRCFQIFIKARGMQVDRWLTSGSRIYSWADTAWERWYPSTCGNDRLPNVNDDIYMKFDYVCKPHPWVGHPWSKTGWAPVTEVGGVERETKSTMRCPGRKVGNETKDAVQLMKMKAEGINENEESLRQFYFLKSLLWNLMLYIVNNIVNI